MPPPARGSRSWRPGGETEIDPVPPYDVSLLVQHASSGCDARAFLNLRMPASLGRPITRPELRASLSARRRDLGHRDVPRRPLCRHARRDGAARVDGNYGAAVPDRTARILLVSGSIRSGSTNTALLRAALAASPPGVEARLFEAMTDLPHFNPDDDVDPLPAAVVHLRSEIAAADAVLFCTPEYAGALPGTFKNLLDWTVGGPEMYGKPVAWVNASSSPTRGAKAHESLETVLRTIHADVAAEACRHVEVARGRVVDGLVTDPGARDGIAEVLAVLGSYALARTDWDPASARSA